MVWPQVAIVQRDLADLRAAPSGDSELVDQAQYGENVRVLGESDRWRYVQGADHYFGWVTLDDLAVLTGYAERFVVAVLLADVRDAPRGDASVIARLPTGTSVPAIVASMESRPMERTNACRTPIQKAGAKPILDRAGSPATSLYPTSSTFGSFRTATRRPTTTWKRRNRSSVFLTYGEVRRH